MAIKRFMRRVKDKIPYDKAVSVQRINLLLNCDSSLKNLTREINCMLIQSPKILPNNFVIDILEQKNIDG